METTYTIEVLQEDIDNAVNYKEQHIKASICTCCIITQALNRTFKGEIFDTAITLATSGERKLKLSKQAANITYMHNRDWKNVKPFTFTATEY